MNLFSDLNQNVCAGSEQLMLVLEAPVDLNETSYNSYFGNGIVDLGDAYTALWHENEDLDVRSVSADHSA